ncbi:biotin-dependent carboxyltransferase family protein [Alkalihalobacillus sp. 1P02AB]|uniref:5-oxoprolinase subunit C family protein n=1 Tax=Alkalihalobacillus sp. 1P02AB TaxID=3132260 RepID=UPI0039A77549
MESALFTVEKPGLLSTIQDQGRYDFLRDGMSPSGAIDFFAFQIGNLLLGNEKNAPALELTIVGPTLKALSTCQICITGADLEAKIDDKQISCWKVVTVKKGQRLTFSVAKKGMRAYLAVRGGFAASYLFGSYSTYLRANIGGYEGRALQRDDVLYRLKDDGEIVRSGFGLGRGAIPTYHDSEIIRVVLGPDEACFTEEALSDFISKPFTVSNQSDRMGVRLEGDSLSHLNGKTDILSEAVTFGTIQVPASGKPIILMADRQTTGGYPRIGHVISVDLPKVAQARPGDRFVFEAVSVEEAQQLWKEYRQFVKTLECFVQRHR